MADPASAWLQIQTIIKMSVLFQVNAAIPSCYFVNGKLLQEIIICHLHPSEQVFATDLKLSVVSSIGIAPG